MKTFRQGDPNYARPWYLRVSFVCTRCGWAGQPEHESEVRRSVDQHDSGDHSVSVTCPDCGQSITNVYDRIPDMAL